MMNKTSIQLRKLLFNKSKNQPLTKDELLTWKAYENWEKFASNKGSRKDQTTIEMYLEAEKEKQETFTLFKEMTEEISGKPLEECVIYFKPTIPRWIWITLLLILIVGSVLLLIFSRKV